MEYSEDECVSKLKATMKQPLNCTIFAAIAVFIFSVGCQRQVTNSGSQIAAKIQTSQEVISSMKLEICMTCKTIEDVRAFEDSLGSKRIVISDGDYWKAFERKPFTIRQEDDSTYLYSDTVSYSETNVYFEVFVRKCKSDSFPQVVVLYTFQYERILSDDLGSVLQTSGSQLKFFFDDPVLNRYVNSDTAKHAGTNFIPDSAFIQAIFDTLTFNIDRLIPKGSEKDIKYNSDFYDEMGEYIYGKGTYYGAMVDTFDRPHQADSEWSVSLWESRGDLAPAPYREMYRSVYWDSGNSRCILNLGWAVSQEYYVRRKIRGGKNYYHFDLKPKDLAIYLFFIPQ
jgi:hypothetical protein